MIPPRSFYFEYWQYSWHGDVAGIYEDCDLDIRVIGKTTVTDPANVMTATAEWEVTAPPEQPTEPTAEPTAPSESETEPTQSETEPTEGTTDPTESSADPTAEGTPTGEPEPT